MMRTSTGFKCLFCKDKVLAKRKRMYQHIRNIHSQEKALTDNLIGTVNEFGLEGVQIDSKEIDQVDSQTFEIESVWLKD